MRIAKGNIVPTRRTQGRAQVQKELVRYETMHMHGQKYLAVYTFYVIVHETFKNYNYLIKLIKIMKLYYSVKLIR